MTGLGYTVPAAASVAVVCGAELVVLQEKALSKMKELGC